MALSRLIASVLLSSAATASATPMHVFYSRGPVNEQLLIGQMLVSHNAERRRVGLAPLAWDPRLADGARAYANDLVRSGALQHSPKALRPGIGENLWKGTRGYFAPAAMVGGWMSERSMFRSGRFPDVSTSGNWADVGHYTQMIGPTTERVGCAIGQSVAADVLVCRYWPSGNVNGKPVP
jgi:hypothetical protein